MADLVLTWETGNLLEAAEELFGVGRQLGRMQVHEFLQKLQAQLAAQRGADTFMDGVNDVAPAVWRQDRGLLERDPLRPNRVDVDTSFDRQPVMDLWSTLLAAGVRPGAVSAIQDVKREVDEACENYDTEVEDWETEQADAPDPDDDDYEDYEPTERPDSGYRDGHVYVLQAAQAHCGVTDEELDE